MKAGMKTVLLILGCSIFASGCSLSYSSDDLDEEAMNVIKEETVSDDISDISIDWIGGDLTFLESDDDHIRIVERATDNFEADAAFTYSVSDKGLSIKDKNNNNFKVSINVRYELSIYLPKKQFESINIQGDSGDITAGNLNAKSLTADAVTSDYDLSGSFEEVAIETSSGNVELNCFTMPGNISIDGNSADVMLVFPENDGFTLAHDLTSGDLTCEFSMDKKEDGIEMYGTGARVVNISLTSGDLSVLKK